MSNPSRRGAIKTPLAGTSLPALPAVAASKASARPTWSTGVRSRRR
ncbi:hypothetical protein [Massilia sp. HP4]|nr:hypothetical protein [Massilia sp. HP4]